MVYIIASPYVTFGFSVFCFFYDHYISNYHSIIIFTGSAISHFRFKDEVGWEDPGNKEGDEDGAQMLSLNCNNLAEALDCLPLYTQLQLDPSLFLVSKIKMNARLNLESNLLDFH